MGRYGVWGIGVRLGGVEFFVYFLVFFLLRCRILFVFFNVIFVGVIISLFRGVIICGVRNIFL